MKASEFPDEYLSELDEDEWGPLIEKAGEVDEGREEHRRLMELLMTANVLSEMFEENHMTLQKYIDLTDYLEDEMDKLDVGLL